MKKLQIIMLFMIISLFICASSLEVKAATATIIESDGWTGASSIDENTTWTFQNGAIVTLNNPITISSGVTLTLKGHGGFSRNSTNVNEIFIVTSGGKLVIEGTSTDQPFIIDGKSVIAEKSLITSSGELIFNNAVIQNGKNRAAEQSVGGGIHIGAGSSMIMNNCIVTKNTAKIFGGGIYCRGTMTINNSVISHNIAATGTNEESNLGRGGGFHVQDENAECTMNNTIVEKNEALYYGGGGQVSGGAKLVMEEGTVFRENKALLHGAGALHLTGNAEFIMNGGSMENNFAQYCGGAIHSSYSCKLELNKGKIKNNISNGRGGGIHINTGGAITLNEHIIISDNKVYKKRTGTYAEVDSTGDTISNMKYEGSDTDFGYGGGVLIDSGTCTVAGATIEDNYAEVGGGGIGLVMLNATAAGLDDLLVVNFTMTSGIVSGNKTDGNGAGVYMMSNKIKENIINTYGAEGSKEYIDAISKLENNNPDRNNILTQIPVANVSGGTINDNTATDNGGGLYLDQNTKFIISGTGDISNNKAVDGAGAYIASGTVEINGGTMSENKASANGGAIYVSGAVKMTEGIVDNNEAAANGGALYVSQGDFEMTSGSITNNKATGSVSDGGGAYVIGGDIVIGVNECDGKGEKHSVEKYQDKIHPLIVDNKAVNCGGGIAVMGDGNITMYCGKIINNEAINRGRGLNIYMQSGQFDYYSESADVGETTEPELVIVGGKLVDHKLKDDGNDETTLNYYHCNKSEGDCDHEVDYPVKEATATTDSYINLPDGEYYWDAAEGTRFFGWTFYGPNDEEAKANVRTKDDYKAMGLPIQVTDMTDGRNDKAVNMYALWAPIQSKITYYGSVIKGVYTSEPLNMTNEPTYYSLKETSSSIEISNPVKDGYTFVGWYMYQDLDQNANWGYEPVFKDVNNGTGVDNLDFNSADLKFFTATKGASSTIPVEAMTFGDITLIAKFEPAFTDLKITKNVDMSTTEANQVFMFEITGKPYDTELSPINMTVCINGKGSTLVKHLPIGKYTVTELTDWSWQYGESQVTSKVVGSTPSIEGNSVIEFTLTDPEKTNENAEEVQFTNIRTTFFWLSGDSYMKNQWTISSIIQN